MKKSIVTKAASIILASSLMLGMTACGDSSKSDDNGTASSAAASSKAEDKEITGKTETWGVFTVLVPDGWELKKGHTLDEKDPNYCTVKKSSFTYFELKSEKEIAEPYYIAVRANRTTGWINFRVGPSKITSRVSSFP